MAAEYIKQPNHIQANPFYQLRKSTFTLDLRIEEKELRAEKICSRFRKALELSAWVYPCITPS